MGKRNTVEKNVQINPRSIMAGVSGAKAGAQTGYGGRRMAEQQGFFANYKWYILGIAVILLFVEYKRYVKRKNRNLKMFGFMKEEVLCLAGKVGGIKK